MLGNHTDYLSGLEAMDLSGFRQDCVLIGSPRGESHFLAHSGAKEFSCSGL